MKNDGKPAPLLRNAPISRDAQKGRAKVLPFASHNHDFPPSSFLVLHLIYHVGQTLSMGFGNIFCEKLIFFSYFFGRFHRKICPVRTKRGCQGTLFAQYLV